MRSAPELHGELLPLSLLLLWPAALVAVARQGRRPHAPLRTTTDSIPDQVASRLSFGDSAGLGHVQSSFGLRSSTARRGCANNKQSKESPIKKITRSDTGPTMRHQRTSVEVANVDVPEEIAKAKRQWVLRFLSCAKDDKPDDAIATLRLGEFSHLARYLELRDYNLLMRLQPPRQQSAAPPTSSATTSSFAPWASHPTNTCTDRSCRRSSTPRPVSCAPHLTRTGRCSTTSCFGSISCSRRCALPASRPTRLSTTRWSTRAQARMTWRRRWRRWK